MAYTVAWDAATPVGATTAASDIDTEFQNLKTSIQERMNDLIGATNWETDGVDPKKISFDSLNLSIVHAQASANVSFSVSGSDQQPWTEDINTGSDVSIASSVITFDVAGTYMFWITAKVNIDPAVNSSGLVSVGSGTATIYHVAAGFDQQYGQEVSVIGVAVATAGQTMQVNRIATVLGTDVVYFNDMALMLMRVA